MEKLLVECIQEQNSELLQEKINSGVITLSDKNIVRILYFLDNLFWKENQDINLDFFECLLKNGIPLDSQFSKEHKTTAIEKIICSIENNRNAEQGKLSEIHKKTAGSMQLSDENVSYLAKFQKYESKLENMLYLLVSHGANPNIIIDYAIGCDNISLLEYSYNVNKKLFKLLVEKGADVNVQYVSESIADLPQTPLSNAIEEQNIEIVKLLIEHNVEIEFWSYYALFQKFESYYLWNTVDKIKYNDLNSIRKSTFSLTKKVESFEDKTEKIKIDRKFDELFEILKLLIEYKMYINCTFRHKSIFDLSIEAGDYKTIESFLENKIDELEKVEMIDMNNKPENNSENLYDFANSMIKHQDIRNLEKTRKLENNPYYKEYSVKEQNKPSVSKALLSKDIEQFKNTITKEIANLLPITDFIKEDYSLEFLQVSIDNGSDINFQDSNGKTALILACELNKIDIVKYLLTKNIDLNIEDTNLKKAIQYVKDYELIKLFLVSLKKQHQPQKLVKLLSNFTIDTPFKLTTHLWEDPKGELFDKYGSFDGYMSEVKKQFESMQSEIEELSPNLYKKICAFLIDKKTDESDSWCSKTPINIGWSSLEGLKEWCDSGKLPKDFKLQTPIFIGRKQIVTFGEIVDLFKQEIEVKATYHIASLPDVEFSKRDFYTDTQKFSTAIAKIFEQMKNEEYPQIEVSNKDLSEDRSIEIKITQVGSPGYKNAESMLQEINDGDFVDIKESLKNLCDWSIESSFEDENFRVNFLHSNNVKDIEILETKPKGFTHILRFYK